MMRTCFTRILSRSTPCNHFFKNRFLFFSSATTTTPSSSSSSSSSKPIKVAYLTDLEGDYDYWQQFLHQSSDIFEIQPHSPSKSSTTSSSFLPTPHYLSYTPPYRLKLKDSSYHFIFGGDLIDRLHGDLRLLIDFLQLSQDYPQQIHFILGNRDINKLRLVFSLHQPLLSLFHSEVYWLHGGSNGTHPFLEEGKKEILQGSPIAKLKWILSKTMGAPLAFENRREELKNMRLNDSDEDVLNSYLSMMQPFTGLLWNYLIQGKIALIQGDNLFLHGALHEHNIGWVPPTKRMVKVNEEMIEIGEDERFIPNLIEWVEAINTFARNELMDYSHRSSDYLYSATHNSLSSHKNINANGDFLWEVKGFYDHQQPGSRLVQYGMGGLPNRKRNNSVIYASYLSIRDGKPHFPSEKVSQYLQANGINRLFVGHQPNGDAPWIMNSHDIQIISADSAYSKGVLWPIEHFLSYDSSYVLPSSDQKLPEFISFHDFTRKFPDHPLSVAHQEALSSTDSLTTPPFKSSNYGSKHSTRSINAMARVTLSFPQGIETGKTSQVHFNGSLSDRSHYHFDLKSISSTNSSSFIGMKTKDDWFVKAAHVKVDWHPSYSASKSYYLLSKTGDSFQFLNRIIEEQQLLKELYGSD